MIQVGDPSGDGTGGNSIWNKPFEDEFFKPVIYHIRGAHYQWRMRDLILTAVRFFTAGQNTG